MRVGGSGTKLSINGVEQPLVASLFVGDTALLAESESKLQKVEDEFNKSCKTRANVAKKEKFLCLLNC